jgi:hypothetical protein
MNIHFSQIERRSQLFSYLLVAFAICTLMMLILSFSRYFENRWTMPSASAQMVYSESASVPVAIPAPHPPAEQIQISITFMPSGGENPVPQVVAIPVPSVP